MHDSWSGYCRLPGEGRLNRRLDVKVYRPSAHPFAMIYFTGSDYLNRRAPPATFALSRYPSPLASRLSSVRVRVRVPSPWHLVLSSIVFLRCQVSEALCEADGALALRPRNLFSGAPGPQLTTPCVQRTATAQTHPAG